MKNIFVLLMTLLLVLSCVSLGADRAASGNLEVYEGMADGYRGAIHVQVIISEGSIDEIIILDSMEDRFVGGAAIEELIEAIIEFNSTDVDAVTGATISSKGFLDAVNNAIMGL